MEPALLQTIDQKRPDIAERLVASARGPRSQRGAILGLIAFSAITTALLDVPLIRSDGFAYYVWLEAIFRDHTFDLAAAAQHYARFITYQTIYVDRTGHYASQFAFGAAILWSPFYLVSLLLDNVQGALLHGRDADFLARQGDTLLHSFAISFGTWVYVTAALVLAFLISRRLVGVGNALLVTIALFFGTPLYYYTAIEPTMAHGVATFAVTLALWLVVRSGLLPLNREGPALGAPLNAATSSQPDRRGLLPLPRYWFVTGLVVGLGGTVRWQLILIALPIGLLLLSRGRRTELVGFTAGVILVFVTVPLSWVYEFGSPSPAAVGTVRDWLPRGWVQVLFSPASGIFAWSPITILAVGGLAGLFSRDSRRTGAALIGMFVLQVAVNSVAGDPTAGLSFGMRRLTEMYPVFVIGLSWLFQEASRRSRRVQGSFLALTLVCTSVGLWLFMTYVRAIVDPATGTVIDAVIAWLPPHTIASFDTVRATHPFGFGP